MVVTSGIQVQRTRTGTSPGLLDEVKAYLQIDMDDHDQLLGVLIASAVEKVESYCGVSIIPATVKVYWKRLGTTEELPYGPVQSIITATGAEITGLIPGFAQAEPVVTDPVTIEYEAGYVLDPDTPITLPEGLRLAIMKLVADDFEHRTGVLVSTRTTVQFLPNNWKSVARPYRRIGWI